jgi:hypothetical protein
MNKKVLEFQLKDLEIKKKKEMEFEEEKLNKIKERNLLFKEIAEKNVKELEEKSKNFIDPNNLEYEIEKMLNSLENYNYCVDNNGVKYTDYQKFIQLKKIERAAAEKTNN